MPLRLQRVFCSIPREFMHGYKGFSDRWTDYSSGVDWSSWGVEDAVSVMSESGVLVSGSFSVLAALVFGQVFMG